MRKLLSLLLLGVATCGVAQTPSTIGQIEVLAPEMETYADAASKIEVLAGGFTWTEGPVWIADDGGGHLLFSDIPRNSIFRWSQSRGVELFMRPSGYTGVSYYGLEPGSNGLTLDAEHRLTMCEHGDRRVSVLSRGGGKRTLVDRYQGKRLNSPNDLTFDKSGNLYFTDPPYGLPERADDPRRELDFCGVYRLGVDGSLTLLTKEMTRPNGIALSPDEKTLYVAQSDPERPIWMAFPIGDDGKLAQGKVLHDAKPAMEEYPGLPDGMTVKTDGTIFGSGPGAIYVLSPVGKLLGRIITGGRVSNCTFDAEETYLYITADKFLCRIKMK
ncbi:Gluconolactonase precursor [Stieleria neptunia]|uniref:Gluconolactonase n=1 Tax=Stieleria neptunia TaxID=2527979 RepID=A0A518HQM1_9BACT|nr:SMP-30/gluconolactonase/LRE family protein [Stieleria neptunia]QDV43107.1 Gluconolactonase precursor [Stieleria neptunia]